MTYTFTLVAKEAKSGYFRFAHSGRSIYVPKAMFAAEPPATLSITADGIAEPKASKATDPVALQAQADKAAASAQRAAERAQKLTAQLEQLKAQQAAASADQHANDQHANDQQPEAKAAGRGKKAKAA